MLEKEESKDEYRIAEIVDAYWQQNKFAASPTEWDKWVTAHKVSSDQTLNPEELIHHLFETGMK